MRSEETISRERPERPAVAGALGLCAKAGRLVFGTTMICEALKANKRDKTPLFVVMARDASDNTAKRLQDRCRYYGVSLARGPLDTEALGRAVGKSPLAAVGITDGNLAKLVRAKLGPAQEVAECQPDSRADSRDEDAM